MTPEDIRAAIAASPELQALVPNTVALANALSLGRVKLMPREIGNGLILATIGLEAGNTLLDLIANEPIYRHVRPLLEQGRLDISTPLARASIDTMVSTEHAIALKALAEVADPVEEMDVRHAIFASSGELLV